MYEENATESTGPMMEDRSRINGGDMVKQDHRSKQEMLRDYEINIRFLSVGCVVSVGCRQIPFTNVGDAMVEINKYVHNPTQERERWYKIFDSAE
jgi:hypothetical protein